MNNSTSSHKKKTSASDISHTRYVRQNSSTSGNFRNHDADYLSELAPLMRKLKLYDKYRIQLERNGGGLPELNRISRILRVPIVLRRAYQKYPVFLNKPQELKKILDRLGFYDIHLDIRLGRVGMPVHYLCRINWDFWSEYGFVVEDIYRSPGYALPDPRFVSLMDMGHEKYFLRFSDFREKIKSSHKLLIQQTSDQIDELIYTLGKYVFRAAWHEDQQSAILISKYFNIHFLQQAIELLYLCLNGELCDLRNQVNSQMLLFFESIHPQPAIHEFLSRLNSLEGDRLNKIDQTALALYSRLQAAFSEFLKTEVTWGNQKIRTFLFKLIFGNLTRLDLISASLGDESAVWEATRKLNQVCEQIISEILN